MADRFSYIPLMGLFIAVAWGVPEITIKWRNKKIILGLAMAIIIPALALSTFKQARLWQNSGTLYTHALAVTTDNWFVHRVYGKFLFDNQKPDQAVYYYQKSLDILPNSAPTHHVMGNALSALGQTDKAISHYNIALDINPEFAEVHNSKGIMMAQQNQLEKARFHFEKAVRLDPQLTQALYNLALLYFTQKDFANAITCSQDILKINPHDIEAINILKQASALNFQVSDPGH